VVVSAAPHHISRLPGRPDVLISVHQFSESLGRAMSAKALWAGTHSEEVALVGEILARAMGLPAGVARMVHLAGHLHDIGKIGIPDFVLHKPARLNREEFRIIQEHSAIGEAIVRPVMALDGEISIPDIVRHHHERYDGSGYPDGLRGEDIPLGARVIAVADSLSAMLQDRPYKSPVTFREAEAELMSLSGQWYDPDVLAAFAISRGEIQEAVREARRTQLAAGNRWSMCELDPESCTRLHGGEQLRDRLTGVYSRRYFGQFLAGVLSAPATENVVHLALLDCDRFRDFNLTHGQEAGDRMLALLGTVICSSVRESADYPFRFGRDVFGVAFRDLDMRSCAAVCERIRARFRSEGQGCTVSIGLAAWTQDMGCDPEALVEAARSALSRAKEDGRDCLRAESAPAPGMASGRGIRERGLEAG
jgi:diguanylate cyclase (GGDEF)-like protein